MMLEFLGQAQAADALMRGIEATTAAGCLTRDLGGRAGTGQFTDQVLDAIGKARK